MDVARRYMRFLTVALVLCFLAIELRLFHLQVLDHPGIRARADGLYSKLDDTLASRGRILTRSGFPLAESIPAVDVYADHRWTGYSADDEQTPKERRDEIAAILSSQFPNVPYAEIRERLDLPGYRRLFRQPLVEADAIIELWRIKADTKTLNGIDFTSNWVRRYSEGSAAGNVIGYVNAESDGCAGLELALHAELTGTGGYQVFRRDAAQRRIFDLDAKAAQPTPGHDVRLTIDVVLQHFAENALDQVVKDYRPEWATLIAMDPRTGEILAMANRPGYDPGDYSAFPVENHQVPAVSFQYTPGSAFKPFVMACAVERSAIRFEEQIDCSEFVYKNRSVGEAHEFGLLTPAEILIKSSNRGMAKIAMRLVPGEDAPREAQIAGFRRLRQTFTDLGFTQPTRLGFPLEVPGYLAQPEAWKHQFTLASVAFGHEIAVTPVQLAAAFSSLANGGVYLEPYLIQGVAERDGTPREWGPEERISRRVYSRRTADIIRDMLVRVVDEGTGHRAAIDGYSVAGKTSTAQWEKDHSKYTASFVGFAPASDPRLLVAVVVDQPHGKSHYGGTVAAPAAQDVLSRGLEYLRVPMDRMLKSAR